MISLHLRCSEVFCSNSVSKILAGLLLIIITILKCNIFISVSSY